MKQVLSICFLVMGVVTPLFAQTNDADRLLGVWQTAEKDGKIELYKSGAMYAGKLIWGADMFERDGKTRDAAQSKKDVNNPDPALQKRPLQNLVILTGFTYRDGIWDGGSIYDPESGKTYRCTMKLKNGKLDIRGYVGLSLFGKTVTWSRVN